MNIFKDTRAENVIGGILGIIFLVIIFGVVFQGIGDRVTEASEEVSNQETFDTGGLDIWVNLVKENIANGSEQIVAGDYLEAMAYYNLNTGAGATAKDSIDGYTGTVNGVTWNPSGVYGESSLNYTGAAGEWLDIDVTNADFPIDDGAVFMYVNFSDAGKWSDGTTYYLAQFRLDSNNRMYIAKWTSNEIKYVYTGGGTAKTINHAVNTRTDTDFHLIGATWSQTDDEFKAFFDGQQVGTTLTGLGTWAGQPVDGSIGSSTNGASLNHNGSIDEVILFNQTPTADQISFLNSTYNGLKTYYTRGIDYNMNYTDGSIYPLSTGNLTAGTDYQINYQYLSERFYDNTALRITVSYTPQLLAVGIALGVLITLAMAFRQWWR